MKRNTTHLSRITWSKSKCAVSKQYLNINKTNIMKVFINKHSPRIQLSVNDSCAIVVWITLITMCTIDQNDKFFKI